MRPSSYRMTSLDRCAACSLVFLDRIELDFLTGRNIEQAFFQDPRVITHCAHCGEHLTSPSHCGTQQQHSCSACKQTLYRSKIMLRVPAQPSEDPYRGGSQVNGPKQFEDLSYQLMVCVHCQGILLEESLLTKFLELFAPEEQR